MENTPSTKSFFEELYFCRHFTSESARKRAGKVYSLPERMIIVFTDHGSLKVNIDKVLVNLKPTELLVLRPQQQIDFVDIDDEAEVFIIGFFPALPEILMKQFSTSFFTYMKSRNVWSLSARGQRAIRSFYDVFEYSLYETSGDNNTEIANSLFSAFLQTFHQKVRLLSDDMNVSESQTQNTRNIGGKFFSLLGEHYKEHHSVAYYAGQLCISSKYLTQIIKNITGVTPKELIDRRLGLESLFLLTKTNMNIQEISIELGFPDQSYFGRFFKRLFGMAPLHYRSNPDLGIMEKVKEYKEI